MLACIVLAISLGMVSGHPPSYTYPDLGTGANGWTGLCMSGGTQQSPIDLDHSMTATVHSPITYKNYFNGHFNKHHKGVLVYDKTGCKVDWYPNHKDKTKVMSGAKWRTHCPNIRNGPYDGTTHTHAFYLWHLHFHWGEVNNPSKGSEHTVNGKAYALELHMVHIEDDFIDAAGKVDFAAAKKDKWGIAVLGILFNVVPNKPQNQEPLSKIDDKVWEFHYHPRGKRSAEEIEEAELEHYHNLNMRSLSYGFTKIMEAKKEKRHIPLLEEKLKLNIGAFIRKATRNGAAKTMSTYWTYKGSLTTPGCDEAVTWVVYERALPIAQVQANAFASLCSNTYRRTQTVTAAHDLKYLIHNKL